VHGRILHAVSYAEIPGWMDYEDVYDEAVRRAPSGATLVEIGVGFGRSLAYLAEASRRANKRFRIVGVDPLVDDWGSEHPTWGAEHAAWARSLGGPVNALFASLREHAPCVLEDLHLLRCRSLEAARIFADGSVHFVFVDGNHHYEHVLADFRAWWPKLVRPGGMMAGHDWTREFPGVERAVSEFFALVPERRGTSFLVRT
jgi:cephalosporin hydroxylase